MGVKRGDRVSLNTSKRLYYFQEGERGINLSSDSNLVAIIPQTATEYHLAQIDHDLKSEHLVLGWPEKHVEELDKDSDLQGLLDGGRTKIDNWIHDLKDDKNTKTADKVAKIERILELEKAGKNRISVIRIAENVLNAIGGISKVEETDQSKIEIKLTSGTEEIAETT